MESSYEGGNKIVFKSIGTIHTPFMETYNMPIQPSAAMGVKGYVIINKEFAEALDDLDGFSHIYLLYHFHKSKSFKLKVIPFLDKKERGLFSTRAPKRPNPIGLSVAKLNKIDGNTLEIENVDILDGTPLLDIKPYVPEINSVKKCTIGWLAEYKKELKTQMSDKRYW
jgi:tRNA-Thr(GGU) m(6)t(6)A37 methyltransferase TsaA